MMLSRKEIIEATECANQTITALYQMSPQLVVAGIVFNRNYFHLESSEIEITENSPLGALRIDRQVIDVPDRVLHEKVAQRSYRDVVCLIILAVLPD